MVQPMSLLQPTAKAILADITCDCDGRIDNFIINGEHQAHIPLHSLKDNADYLLGVFLVGAYQETLGDLHNLLGDTNVVSVGLTEVVTESSAKKPSR